MSVVIDELVCQCCSLTKPSNEGLVKVSTQQFECFTCVTNAKITKQNNWLTVLSAQNTIINNALTEMASLDALDIVNLNIQNNIIMQSFLDLRDAIQN